MTSQALVVKPSGLGQDAYPNIDIPNDAIAGDILEVDGKVYEIKKRVFMLPGRNIVYYLELVKGIRVDDIVIVNPNQVQSVSL